MNDKGFSAVELLIALILATVFILAGYQVATSIIRSGAESEQLAKAANIAHEYLRRNSTSADPCAASTPVNNAVPDNSDGLPNARVTVVRSCPNTSITSLSKITSTVTYGPTNASKTVSHAVFVE